MKWLEVSLITERVVAEDATTLFSDYADNGIIEEDVPYEIERIKLTMYTGADQVITEVIKKIQSIIENQGFTIFDIACKMVDDTDWLNSWQQYIEPVEILPNLVVKPSWQAYEKKGQEDIIEIYSKLSFGTGDHVTTRGCAKLLSKYVAKLPVDSQFDFGDTSSSNTGFNEDEDINNTNYIDCLDIGTGTGILLLVAEKIGLHSLVGIDIDQEAAEQAKINCAHNKVKATVICGDLDQDFHGKAKIILANLTVDPLKILLPIISKKLVKNGILIISGIIDDRYEEILPYITENWLIKDELIENSWHTFALEAK